MSRYVAKLIRQLAKPGLDYIATMKQKARDSNLKKKYLLTPLGKSIYFKVNF